MAIDLTENFVENRTILVDGGGAEESMSGRWGGFDIPYVSKNIKICVNGVKEKRWVEGEPRLVVFTRIAGVLFKAS